MIVITQQMVRAHLSYAKASELIADGVDRLANGDIESPPRHVFRSQTSGPVLGFMPAVDKKYMSAKIAAVSYANVDQGLDCHQGAVLLFDRGTAELKATIDVTELTAIRTTAVSHLVLSSLKKSDRSKHLKLAIIGSGVQAFHHIQMLQENFETSRFVVVSHSQQRVQDLEKALRKDKNIALEHRPYGADLQDCELILTATHGADIVLRRTQISASALVIAMGACQPKAQEIDQDILSDCLFIVDSKEAALTGSGEGLTAVSIERQRQKQKPIYDLHDLVSRRIPKVHKPTVFKSVGLGFEDLVCAVYLYETLKRHSDRLSIKDFGGRRAY